VTGDDPELERRSSVRYVSPFLPEPFATTGRRRRTDVRPTKRPSVEAP